ALAKALHPVHVGHGDGLDAGGGEGAQHALDVGGLGKVREKDRSLRRRPDFHALGSALPEEGGGDVLVGRGDRDAVGAQAQPSRSFIRSRSDRSRSLRSGTGRVRPSCSSSFFCSDVRCFGTTTRTSTWRSPRPLLPRWGKPWWRMRRTVPGCVPSGTCSFVRPPSSVGTPTEAPRAAWVTLTGISQNRLDPSRLKNSCSLTRTTT